MQVINKFKFYLYLTLGLCKIDFPLGKWNDIIPNLVNNCYHEKPIFRLASIETLGFICEELTSRMIDNTSVDQILSAIISNIKTETPEEILIASLKAFLNVISLAGQNFSNPVRMIL